MAEAQPLGRTDLVDSVRTHLDSGGSAVLTGEAGIGKSTVLAATAIGIAATGTRLLRCSPSRADAELPFLAMSDLLESLPESAFERLPAVPRRAVRAALLRGEPTDRPEPLAVRVGVRHLLQDLAGTGTVVLVIDDLQWLDVDSEQALAYALKRIPPARLRVLAAERVTGAEPGRYTSLLPSGTAEFTVGPLGAEALVTLLRQRSDGLIRRPLAMEICRATAGNPLYALEIAAAVLRQGRPPATGTPLPVPEPFRDLLGDRLATVSAEGRATLLVAAAAARPTLTLLQQAGRARAIADLAEAGRCGVADLLDDGSVLFRHPLMRAVVYQNSPVAQRLTTHARLADVVADPVQRARHLSAAYPVQNEVVASVLIDAAGVARRRGAPGIAAELAELAADRTPVGNRQAWAERRLAAAAHAEDAGRYEEARKAVEAVLAAEVPAGARTRAKLMRLEQLGQAILQARDLVAEVLAESAGDQALNARARLYSAYLYRTGGQYAHACAEARRSAEQAQAVGDVTTEFLALEVLLSALRLTGDARYPEVLAHALARVAACPQASPVAFLIGLEQARYLIVTDQPARARDELVAAIPMAEHSDDPTGLAYVLQCLVYADVRLGRCGNALRTAALLRRMADDGDEEHLGGNLAARAMADLYGRSATTAQALAEQGVEESRRIDDHTYVYVNGAVLGAARLFAGDADGAVEALQQVRDIAADTGIIDYAFFPWPVDLVEALVAAGRLAEAGAVIADAGPAALRLGRRGLAAGLDRSAALLLAARGEPHRAARLLESVVEVYRRLSLPLELARTLVALAAVQRRLRRRAAAENLLREAAQNCQDAQSAPWLERIGAELARLKTTRGPHDNRSLTPVETRIVTMITAGATNREIAGALSISVKTVEGAVSRIYRKLDVHSRVELVRRSTGR